MKKVFLFLLIPGLLTAETARASAALPAVGPDYQRPAVPIPRGYVSGADAAAAGMPHAGPDAVAWKAASPQSDQPRGAWWRLFGDAVLDDLQTQALTANAELSAAAARVAQARALAGASRAALWPQVAIEGAVARERASATTENVLQDTLTTTYRAPLSLAWEIDLFGRARRQARGARADAASSAATYEAVRLALTAEVAESYFTLRAAERERELLRATARLRREAVDLVNARRQNGSAADVDVARAETELAVTESELHAVEHRRALAENALAVLLGVAPGDFRLPGSPGAPVLPQVPAGLPAELLERRPDVAAAEYALAAATERIGVAKAAFFPSLSLTGAAGFASGQIDQLFQADSRAWSIGPRLYLPIFQGGRNRANLARSEAAFTEAVALYRQQVLVAFREVQDALTGTRLLAEQAAAQQRAVAGARRAADLAQVRYEAGFVSYLEVIDAQRTALALDRAATLLEARRFVTAVALIKALGGGWEAPRGASPFTLALGRREGEVRP